MDIEIQKSTTLFQINNSLPSIKSVAFPDRTEPFQLVAKYTDAGLIPPGTEPLLGRWIISDIPKPSDPTKPIPKIKVFVKLNIHGILQVSSAQHLEDYYVDEPVEEPVKPTSPKPDGEKKRRKKR